MTVCISVCNMAWKKGKMHGVGKMQHCPSFAKKETRMTGNSRGINLFIIHGKMYSKILIERQQKITKNKINENREVLYRSNLQSVNNN